MEKEILSVENIEKKFNGREVLKNINFIVYENDFFFILGPSGCGKTTLLRIIAGFTQPDRGRIILNKRDITNLPPNKRNIGFVFQNYALWPHMRVKENIAFGLEIKKFSYDFIEKRVNEMLEMTKLKDVANLYPSQISGGQQQRVALARALVVDPQILLLDEPLSNLDAKLRDEMRNELKRIHSQTKKTMIYVTHDQKEAMTLATNIAIMREKEIVQIGTPYEIYTNPKNLFVASFIGDINILEGKVVEKIEGDKLKIETEEGIMIAKTNKSLNSKNIYLCFRPESITEDTSINTIKGQLKDYEFLGDTLKLAILTEKENLFKISINPENFEKFKKGKNIIFSIIKEKILLFEK
ncbi:MAG: ABC transporter ATP-binding protein [Candidatus Omnitrophica bacterium]|nr:ABC transporter ATP-binding protein [Candidatus Omnitrophota bacterium]